MGWYWVVVPIAPILWFMLDEWLSHRRKMAKIRFGDQDESQVKELLSKVKVLEQSCTDLKKTVEEMNHRLEDEQFMLDWKLNSILPEGQGEAKPGAGDLEVSVDPMDVQQVKG